MKPDWKDAPEWANWLALDYNNKWYWFETKPDVGYKCWETDGMYEYTGAYIYWEDSLEKRP